MRPLSCCYSDDAVISLAPPAIGDATETSLHRRHTGCLEASSWLSWPVTGAHQNGHSNPKSSKHRSRHIMLQELQAQAQQLLSVQEVPWRSLRDISQQLYAVQPKEDSLSLHEACRGSQLVLSAPAKREKSKELLERLSRLQQQVDQQSYNKMVAEVTQQVVHPQWYLCGCPCPC